MKRLYSNLIIILVASVVSVSAVFVGLYSVQSQSVNSVNQKVAGIEDQVNQLNGQVKKVDQAQQSIAQSVASSPLLPMTGGTSSESAVSNSSSQKTVAKTTASANTAPIQAQNDQITAVVQKASPAVVSIVISKNVPQYSVGYQNPFNNPLFNSLGLGLPVYQDNGTQYQEVGAASGFIITPQGYILTNDHVVADTSADYNVTLSDGRKFPAQVIYRDPTVDMAVVKIDATNLPFILLGDSSNIQLGETVIAIGNALGQYSNTVSVGIVSGLNRDITAQTDTGDQENLTGAIQTDAAINPGDSGGPLLDLTGQIIGINVATVVGSNNISFALPINQVKSILAKSGNATTTGTTSSQ